MRNLRKLIVPVFAFGLMSSCGLDSQTTSNTLSSCEEGMNKAESTVALNVSKDANGNYVTTVTDKAYVN